MESVTVTSEFDTPAGTVRDAITDLGPFMRAAGFDAVTVAEDVFHIANHVGLVSIELTLEVVADPDAVLAYRQREGVFSEMETRYVLGERPGGVSVRATTDFELEARLVGPLLDATVVSRQRRREFRGQFDYLDSVERGPTPSETGDW
ncbi:SRPBCC family protein [Haloarcula onubensis]|uniref:SRPBCC family protein n=1 Tax=Haloarcula onubensis TaxID=2950539 RepID=A0ABU2FMU6_9EURY|nr:SRPBCC family protein [Halomicroarcula sp. S3CR25-11]MDS0282085.1 SRPBCC family protein [Halomicroarcula sp. S3CR25-11]